MKIILFIITFFYMLFLYTPKVLFKIGNQSLLNKEGQDSLNLSESIYDKNSKVELNSTFDTSWSCSVNIKN